MVNSSTLQIPCGLADPEREVAYVVGSEGLIHCLDLGSGAVQARTNFAGSPLTIDSGTLIAWTPTHHGPNTIRLLAAVRQGDLLSPKWEQAVQLPQWVEIGSPEPGGFKLEAEIRRPLVVVTWEAHSRYRGGAPPPAQVEEEEKHDERRTIRFDLETGASIGEESAEPASSPEPGLPELPPDKRIVPYRSGASWLTRPWRVGSADVFLARATEEPGIVLIRRYSCGEGGLREIRLTTDPAAAAAVTPDGRFIFIRETGGDPSAWHVFSADSGERVTTLPFDAGTEAVAVVKDWVLYLVVETIGTTLRQSLRCRHLHEGEEMWSHLLSEEARKLPSPPPP